MAPALRRAQPYSFDAEMVVVFPGDFSKEAMLACKEMINEIQICFSSNLNDFMHSQLDCALLSNEVGRMKRGVFPCIGLSSR